MKKLLMFLLLGMFMISFASAMEFDNVKSEKETTWDGSDVLGNTLLEKYKPIEIKNAFGLGETLFEGYLSQHTETCGVECSSTIEINLHNDGVLVDDVIFKTLQKDGSWIEQDVKSYQFYIKTGEEEYSVDDYETQCSVTGTYPNGTKIQSCEKVKVGNHLETKSLWTKYNVGQDVAEGNYTLKLEAEKSSSKTIDWVIETNGETLNEWATWGALSTSLVAYYQLDESSGPVLDELNVNNGTNVGSTRGVTGKVGNAFFLDGTTDLVNITGPAVFSGLTSISFGGWFNTSDTNGYAPIYKEHSAGNVGPHNGVQWGIESVSSTGIVAYVTNSTTRLTINAANNSQDFTNQWIHIMVTWDGADAKLYINGVLNNTYTNGIIGTIPADSGDLVFGTRQVSGIYYNGTIDEIGIWNTSLTSGDITELYNGGSGTTYPFSTGSATLNSPADASSSSTNDVQFNGTATLAGGSTLVNISLYTNESGTWEAKNTTIVTGTSNTTTWTRNLADGSSTLWTIEACDSDGDCGFAGENRTISIDSSNPSIIIESPTSIFDILTIGESVLLNTTINDSNLDTCWYNYNGTNTTITGCLTGVGNSTSFISIAGNNNITVYANDSLGNLNTTEKNWTSKIIFNSNTFNATAFETDSENFGVNVTANASLTAVTLDYNGTDHSLTSQGSGIWNTTINIPTSKLQNNTLKYNFTYASSTINSNNFFQNVTETVFTLCNASYQTRFINISFKDEGNSSIINASIPTSTFVYYLGSGSSNKTLTFINVSNNFNYEFCATPNKTLSVDTAIQFKQGTAYPQRVFETSPIKYSNTTTNVTLYLLSLADGIFVTFQTVNSAEQIISGVEIIANRTISAASKTVGVGTTGDSGSVTFWLNPDFSHDFTFTKSGLPNLSSSFAPTQTSYTIIMGSSSQVQNSSIKGIDYSFLPVKDFLENDTTYTFGFNLTSSFWDVSQYGFDLRLANGTVITGDTSTVSGTQLTKSYDVNNQSIIYLDAFWTISGNTTNVTRVWAIQNTEYAGYSIKTFFTDLSSYLDSGMFGLDSFGRNLIAFIIIFVSVGIMGSKFGIVSPLGITSLAFGMVLFFDVVTGILPDIRGISNLPTFIFGLALLLAIMNEVQSR